MAVSNFQKYVKDMTPTGLCKRDIYNSKELLEFIRSLSSSVSHNIGSGRFEEDMLSELTEIKKLLKVDVVKALERSNAYAPTVQVMNSGVRDSSNLPIVSQNSLNWLTERKIANPSILHQNLALMKRLWYSIPVGGDRSVQESKPMTLVSQESPRVPGSTVDPDVEGSRSVGSDRLSGLGSQLKASGRQALSTAKWLGAPVSPYFDIMKSLWDFAKPLRTLAGVGISEAKDKVKGGVGVIDDAWRSAVDTYKSSRDGSDEDSKAGSDGVEVSKDSDVEVVSQADEVLATSDKLVPSALAFPSEISVSNFSDFEDWLRLWLEPVLRDGLLLESDICSCLEELLGRSDVHLALISYIADSLNLENLSARVYSAGVSKVADSPEVSSVVGSLIPSVDSGVVSASSTPLWDVVSSYVPSISSSEVDEGFTDYVDISEEHNREESERDARAELAELTKSYFDGIEEALEAMRDEAKDESDQTQEILEVILEESDKDGDGFMSSFLSSIVSGLGTLVSGFSSLFSPTFIAGLTGLIGYFSSDTFRNIINSIGGFVFDKAKDFFDPKSRDSVVKEVGGTAAAGAAGMFGASKGLSAVSNSLSKASAVSSRAANVAKATGSGSTALSALSKSQQAASWLSKVSGSGAMKVAGKLGAIGAGVDLLNSGLGFMGFDSEAIEVDEASTGKYAGILADSDLSGVSISPQLARDAGLDNLSWGDYVSTAINGASIGALAGGGWASIVTAVLGAAGTTIAMREEAAHDYKKFAEEHPDLFLQMLAAKKGGLSLDRISFEKATGSGVEGFVKWLQDEKSNIKDVMSYSGTSKTGMINLLQALFGVAVANPHTPIQELPISDITSAIMPLISASPMYNDAGQISDVNVSVSPFVAPGREVFIEQVDDALNGDWFSTDKTERNRIVSHLNELGDDDGTDEGVGYGSPSFYTSLYSGGVILDRPGVKRRESVNLKGISAPSLVNFANTLPVDKTGEVEITSGVRTADEQRAVVASGKAPYASMSSPHMLGRAIDLAYTDGLASYFASKEGYEFLTRNNIDVSFLWAEADIPGNQHFHVQPKKESTNAMFYDPEQGWERYQAYSSMRLSSASGGVKSDYKSDRKVALGEGDRSTSDTKVRYADGEQHQFILDRWRDYEAVGVTDPNTIRYLVAQDGLESAWGKAVPADYNFSGIQVNRGFASERDAVGRRATDKTMGEQRWFRNFESGIESARYKWEDVLKRQYSVSDGQYGDSFGDQLMGLNPGGHYYAEVRKKLKSESMEDYNQARREGYEAKLNSAASTMDRLLSRAGLSLPSFTSPVASMLASVASTPSSVSGSSQSSHSPSADSSGWQYESGKWYSGIINFIRSVGSMFSDSDSYYAESGDTSNYSSHSDNSSVGGSTAINNSSVGGSTAINNSSVGGSTAINNSSVGGSYLSDNSHSVNNSSVVEGSVVSHVPTGNSSIAGSEALVPAVVPFEDNRSSSTVNNFSGGSVSNISGLYDSRVSSSQSSINVRPDPVTFPVVAGPLVKDFVSPDVQPSRLQLASVNVDAINSGFSDVGSVQSGGDGSYVNAPSSSNVSNVYNNTTVNFKNSLYTKQS